MKNFAAELTYHGEMRLEERLSVRAEKAYALADRVWRNGKTIDDFSGKKRRKLEDIAHRHSAEGISLRMHSNYCYIFRADAVLITVYSLEGFMASVDRPKQPRFRGDDDDIAFDAFYEYCKEMLSGISFFVDTGCPRQRGGRMLYCVGSERFPGKRQGRHGTSSTAGRTYVILCWQ